ncbi:MAG: ABC transporter permease [Spirochaetales bacterium]|nr:ABC transporter permease [Spirochaetales bacterium]
MMFVLKSAFRYAFSRTRGQRSTSVMILVGIAIGLIALLVISAVMNGLQTAQLDQLRNLESFDLIVDSEVLSKEDVSEMSGVDLAFNFIETNVLIVDRTSGNSTSSRVRAYDEDVYSSDRMSGSFFRLTPEVDDFNGILVSYTMRGSLGMGARDEIKVTFLKPGKTATIVPYSKTLPVNGFFSTRMTEFSASTVFMDYDEVVGILGEDDSRIGVYVSGNQNKVVKAILEKDPDAGIMTWQEYNRALYSALMLEKTMMYIFLAFIFLIICVNLKNSTRRLLANKQKEGAMLRAIGCSRRKVNTIFLGQGLVICLLGEILGVVVGKLVIANLTRILAFVDMLAFKVTGSRTVLGLIPFNASIGNLEIAFVCLFVFCLSLLFTAIGCRRIYKSEIMEVILHASY